MLTLLRIVGSKAGWLLLSFFLIVAVLAATQDLPAKVRAWQAEAETAERVAGTLEDGREGFGEAARASAMEHDRQVAALRSASAQTLAQAKADMAMKKRRARERVRSSGQIALLAARGETDEIVASYQAHLVELPLLEQAERLIDARLSNLRLDQRVASHRGRIAAFNRDVTRLEQQRQRARQYDYGQCRLSSALPYCQLFRDIAAQNRRLARERAGLEAEARVIAAARRASEQSADSAAVIRSATNAYAAEADRAAKKASDHTLNQVEDALKRYSGTAAWILLGAVLLPILLKLAAFHLLAPLAARARPIRLGPPAPPFCAGRSDMSVDVPLGGSDELLLRSGLQSTSAGIGGSDRYLLDWRMPFTCLAAGLVNLQRLRSERATHVTVIGGGSDHRVALIEVPRGGAVALSPRALVGIRKPRGETLRVTRPWVLGRLLAWLTFRFRFVVFHGPCALIVQGRDGIRAEDAAGGRSINRRLTLGFDAALAYAAERSASFLPYYRGEASLFVDRFAGTGHYLHEQRSAAAGAGGVWGRGVRGIGDGLLKAVGI